MNFKRYWQHHLSRTPPDNKEKLDELVELIRKTSADIIGLCEVDRCAEWSKQVDQPKYVSEQLGYDYCYNQNYRSPLPVVYAADTGNAVLSRFPLDKFSSGARRFKHRHFYEFVTAPFGSKEFLHAIHRLPNGRMVHVVCTHLSTNFRRLRELNAFDLWDYFNKAIVPLHEKCGDSYVLMGDLNTVPLYTSQRYGFQDDVDETIDPKDSRLEKVLKKITHFVEKTFPDDYRKDYTLHILKRSKLFKSTMALDPFNPDLIDTSPERYGTYPQKPNRMIDYIFVSPDITTTDIETIPVGFSDHRVIKTEVHIPD